MSINTMSIYESLIRGTGVFNTTAARVNANLVGIDNFSAWKAAENKAFEAFYKYAAAQRKAARMGDDCTIDKSISDAAFAALQNLLDCIGKVNGHALVKNQEMLNVLVSITIVDEKTLAGEALTQKSKVDNLADAVKGIRNGMNPDYVEKITNDLAVARIKLTELKKLEGSCTTEPVRVKINKFYSELEKKMASICEKQDAMTWEELDARDAERKAKNAEKRKANKAAKKAAEVANAAK